jgi:hypothetical protein
VGLPSSYSGAGALRGIVRITGWPRRDVAGRLARWLKSHTAVSAFPRLSSSTLYGSTCLTLSVRDVEGLLAERGLDISYETVRTWVLRFGPVIARRLRRRRPRPSNRWRLDEMGPDCRRADVPLACC